MAAESLVNYVVNKCIDCKYHSVLAGKDWCDFDKKKPKRIKPIDAMKDVPCIKVERKEGKANDD